MNVNFLESLEMCDCLFSLDKIHSDTKKLPQSPHAHSETSAFSITMAEQLGHPASSSSSDSVKQPNVVALSELLEWREGQGVFARCNISKGQFVASFFPTCQPQQPQSQPQLQPQPQPQPQQAAVDEEEKEHGPQVLLGQEEAREKQEKQKEEDRRDDGIQVIPLLHEFEAVLGNEDKPAVRVVLVLASLTPEQHFLAKLLVQLHDYDSYDDHDGTLNWRAASVQGRIDRHNNCAGYLSFAIRRYMAADAHHPGMRYAVVTNFEHGCSMSRQVIRNLDLDGVLAWFLEQQINPEHVLPIVVEPELALPAPYLNQAQWAKLELLEQRNQDPRKRRMAGWGGDVRTYY